MGVPQWIGRPTRAVALVAVGAAGAGAAVAVATVPDSSGVIHACVQQANGIPANTPGNVRIIDPSAGQSCDRTSPAGAVTEQSISWNTVGPQGAPGVPGAPGAPGAQGPPGNTLTISGQTFTIGNGKSLTINGPPAVAPLRPNVRGRPVAELALDVGGTQQSLDVLSWSFGGSQASGGGGGAGKTNVHEIQITKTVDKASPLLFKACANGQHIPKVTLTVRKAGKGQQEFLKITMKDVLISSYQQSNSGGDRPVESLSLNFTKIEYQYTPQK